MISAPTLIGYSGALFGVLGVLFVIFWLKDSRRPRFLWGALSFLMAVCAAAALVDESLLPGKWAGRLAVWCAVLAYGFAWLMVRAFLNRRHRLVWVLLPPTVWLLLRVTVIGWLDLIPLSGFIVCSMVASYNGLAAYELWRSRSENVSSRAYLMWIFSAYAVWNGLRALFIVYLPAPLGVAPNEIWATVIYNLAIVTEALLVGAFFIAFSRERLALQNYRMAVMDPLTGVNNRRAFDRWADEWAASGRKSDAHLAILLFDIDHFKSINDKFGHDIGDDVIVIAARTAEDMLRRQDLVFRIGGEEFVCLLPGSGLEDGFAAAERLREAFRSAAAEVAGRSVAATLSVGIAAPEFGERDLREVLGRADEALYRSKRAGRDRTSIADPRGSERAHSAPGS